MLRVVLASAVAGVVGLTLIAFGMLHVPGPMWVVPGVEAALALFFIVRSD